MQTHGPSASLYFRPFRFELLNRSRPTLVSTLSAPDSKAVPSFPSSGADFSKRSGIKRCWQSRKDKGPPEQTQPAGPRPPHRRTAKRRSSRSKRKLNSRPRNPDVPVTTLDAVLCSDTKPSVVLLGRVVPVPSKVCCCLRH